MSGGNSEQICASILDNRRMSTNDMANHFQINHGSANDTHDRVHFHKVCGRLVPRQLTKQHRSNHLDICNCFLNQYNEEGDAFLHCTVTHDKHGSTIMTQRANAKIWNGNTQHPLSKRSSTQPTAGEIMLTLSCNDHYHEWSVLTSSAFYSEMPCDKLKPMIFSKCQGQPSPDVMLLYDNGHPHTAAHTVQTLQLMC